MTRDSGQGESRIGVFVCECGDKIAGLLAVGAIAQRAGVLPDVVWSGHTGYWCSPDGLARMKDIVAGQKLDRVVIAGCAPRTHEVHFRQALDGRVNPTLVNMVNLRDLCARPHQADPAAALEKAGDQVAMAAADLAARVAAKPRVVRIAPHAVVIGGGIAGMTAALAIGEAGIPVALIEREPDLSGPAHRWPDDGETAQLVAERMSTVRARSNVQVLTGIRVTCIGGSTGCYQLVLSNGQVIEAGAIVVATGGQRQRPEVQEVASADNAGPKRYAFVLCDAKPDHQQTCVHSCCLSALRQAAELKRQVADSEVAILFRELYTAGGTYDHLVWKAQRLGVKFYRYPAGHAPQGNAGQLWVHDELTRNDVRVPCDMLIPVTPITPQHDATDLARMLRLPVDASGFLADTRIRLRPADCTERGIYVCGAAHYPCDVQRAMFEAYSVASRAVRHIRRGQVTHWATAATVDPVRCNGCGDCVRVCPFMAVTMGHAPADTGTRRQGEARLAIVDPLLCTGCGNCVSVCPVKAAQVLSATDEQIEAQVRAALNSHIVRYRVSPCHPISPSPRHLVFACEWSSYSAAEIAGVQGLPYPATTRIIRLNCTGRLQPGLILKALEMGAAGVLVLGCTPGQCHYEQGNERCAAAFEQASGLARLLAMDHRLKLEWILPDNGAQFAQVVTDFVERLKTEGGDRR